MSTESSSAEGVEELIAGAVLRQALHEYAWNEYEAAHDCEEQGRSADAALIRESAAVADRISRALEAAGPGPFVIDHTGAVLGTLEQTGWGYEHEFSSSREPMFRLREASGTTGEAHG